MFLHLKWLNYKLLLVLTLLLGACAGIKESQNNLLLEGKQIGSDIRKDSMITVHAVYTHPSPYKEILLDNVPLSILLIHKSKPWIKTGGGRKEGIRELRIPEYILGHPVDSFNLEVTYKKLLPDSDVYNPNIFSPETPYLIEDIRTYIGRTLVFPFFLNYPCCLNDHLELKQTWTLTSHGGVPPVCPCIE